MGQKNRRAPSSAGSSSNKNVAAVPTVVKDGPRDGPAEARVTKVDIAVRESVVGARKGVPDKADSKPKSLAFKSYQTGTLTTNNFTAIPLSLVNTPKTPQVDGSDTLKDRVLVPSTPAAVHQSSSLSTFPLHSPTSSNMGELNAEALEFTPISQEAALVYYPDHQQDQRQSNPAGAYVNSQPYDNDRAQGQNPGNNDYNHHKRAQNFAYVQDNMRAQSQDARLSGWGAKNNTVYPGQQQTGKCVHAPLHAHSCSAAADAHTGIYQSSRGFQSYEGSQVPHGSQYYAENQGFQQYQSYHGGPSFAGPSSFQGNYMGPGHHSFQPWQQSFQGPQFGAGSQQFHGSHSFAGGPAHFQGHPSFQPGHSFHGSQAYQQPPFYHGPQASQGSSYYDPYEGSQYSPQTQDFGPQDFPMQEDYRPSAYPQAPSAAMIKLENLIRTMPPALTFDPRAFPRVRDGTQVPFGYNSIKRSSPPANAPTAPAAMRQPKTYVRRADIGRKDIIVSGGDLIRNLTRVTKYYTPDGSRLEEVSNEFHPSVYDFATDLKSMDSRTRRRFFREMELEICIDVAAENAEGEQEDEGEAGPPALAYIEGTEESRDQDQGEAEALEHPPVVASDMAELDTTDLASMGETSSSSNSTAKPKDKGKGIEMETENRLVVRKRNILTTLRELDAHEAEFSHSMTSVTIVINYPLDYAGDNSRTAPAYRLLTELVDVLQGYTNLRHLDVVMFVREDRSKRDLLDIRQAELVLPVYDLAFVDWRLMYQLPYMSAPEEVTGWIISHLDSQMRLIMLERDRVLHRSRARHHHRPAAAAAAAIAAPPQTFVYRARRRPSYAL
ncbi:hypothetical protein PVAG01_04894 [Phlyctema vagabunda]|uniref:Uncharacterized protein n=1 Tax=Phlyctema vagabunda TaxID=108571 RepID=A0ABR4PII8_9HELO